MCVCVCVCMRVCVYVCVYACFDLSPIASQGFSVFVCICTCVLNIGHVLVLKIATMHCFQIATDMV